MVQVSFGFREGDVTATEGQPQKEYTENCWSKNVLDTYKRSTKINLSGLQTPKGEAPRQKQLEILKISIDVSQK